MSTSSSSPAPYTYQKPSTIATRSLVSGTKPAETVSTSSHDADSSSDRPVLQRKTTDHYQQAVQQAAAARAETETDASNADSRPVLDRQQSWKHSDLKRGAMEKFLDQGPGHGYSSAAGKS